MINATTRHAQRPARANLFAGALGTMLVFATLARPAYADTAFDTPAPGSRVRRALMNALRPAVEKAYQQPVRFSVRSLHADGTFALAFVEPLSLAGNFLGATVVTTPGGKQLKLDGWAFAILKSEAGQWRVLELDILSDVEGLDIRPEKYPAIPKEVFEIVGLATNAEG